MHPSQRVSVKVGSVVKSFDHFKGLRGTSISSNGSRVSSKKQVAQDDGKRALESKSPVERTSLAKKKSSSSSTTYDCYLKY